MPYRITYGKNSPRTSRTEIRTLKAQLILSCVLFVTLLLVGKLSADGEKTLSEVFLPKEMHTAEVMAQTLAQGGTLRESLLFFCRDILEAAGYEA